MDLLVSMIIFAIFAAFCVAKLEINIEGSDGPWAENLPTYRFKNAIHTFLMGEKAMMTGYHVWLNATFLLIAHFPYFAGFPITLSLEFKILGLFFLAAALEDLFYFIFNPAYGFSKLNPKDAPWHRWVGPLPMLYIVYFSICAIFLLISFLIEGKV